MTVDADRTETPAKAERLDQFNLNYVDDFLALARGGEVPPFWRHFHWGLFDDPDDLDDDPERYFTAAMALTEHVLSTAGVADGRQVLDVGCGFGGTLDHVRARNPGCRLTGINIDERQLRQARELLEAPPDIAFVAADGCKLPVADRSQDHVLAVECIFHFPSRKRFFREAARVLKPGGTLALTDFLSPPGVLRQVARRMEVAGLGDESWYGYMARPRTSDSYERLGRALGLDLLVDDDVTARTLPTYPALRRLYGATESADGIRAVAGLEELAHTGALGYHVLAFRRRST
jgi:SAM-dependent methyltransferase